MLNRVIVLLILLAGSLVPARGQNTGEESVYYSVQQITHDDEKNWKAAVSFDDVFLVYENLHFNRAKIILADFTGVNSDRGVVVDLFKRNANGSSNYYEGDIKWSPINYSFIVSESVNGNYDIFKYSIRSRRLKEIFIKPKIKKRAIISWKKSWEGDVVYNGKGDKIAFVSDKNKNGDIFIFDLKRGKVSQITFTDSMDFAPSFSPDGSKVAYMSHGLGSSDIMLYDLIERKSKKLTNEKEQCGYPVFINDNTIVYYCGNSIMSMNTEGKDKKRLVDNVFLEEGPSVSSDGRYIIYIKDNNDERMIYLYDIKRDKEYKLSTDTSYNIGVKWIRGSYKFIYEAFDGFRWNLWKGSISLF